MRPCIQTYAHLVLPHEFLLCSLALNALLQEKSITCGLLPQPVNELRRLLLLQLGKIAVHFLFQKSHPLRLSSVCLRQAFIFECTNCLVYRFGLICPVSLLDQNSALPLQICIWRQLLEERAVWILNRNLEPSTRIRSARVLVQVNKADLVRCLPCLFFVRFRLAQLFPHGLNRWESLFSDNLEWNLSVRIGSPFKQLKGSQRPSYSLALGQFRFPLREVIFFNSLHHNNWLQPCLFILAILVHFWKSI